MFIPRKGVPLSYSELQRGEKTPASTALKQGKSGQLKFTENQHTCSHHHLNRMIKQQFPTITALAF